MASIKNLQTGQVFTVSENPKWINGMWECGDQRFTDPGADIYVATVDLPLIDPIMFYMAFTPAEAIAIRGSTDPIVQEFHNRLQMAIKAGKPIDPNLVSVAEGLTYLSETQQQPAPSTPTTYILPARIAEILAGTPQ